MNLVLILLILAVFVAGLYGLYYMQKIHKSFSNRVFAGLGAGILFGGVLQLALGTDHQAVKEVIPWIDIVGTGYISFLQMLVIPLVFVSIVSAFTRLNVTEKLGKISSTVLMSLLGTTAVAALIGYGSTILFGLNGAKFTEGTQEAAKIAELATKQESVQHLTIPQQILSFIPKNVFADFSQSRATSTIGVVIFAAFVGVAYLGIKRKAPEEAEFFKKLMASLYKIVMRITTLVLRITPFGVFALMIKVLATSDFAAILNLGKFVIASYAALIVVFMVHFLLLGSVKVSPITYLKKTWTVLSFAFSSRSSAGALPLNIKTQTEALGVDDATANFAGSFGISIGQNGCAGVYPAMLATIVAPTVGVDIFSWRYVLTLLLHQLWAWTFFLGAMF